MLEPDDGAFVSLVKLCVNRYIATGVNELVQIFESVIQTIYND